MKYFILKTAAALLIHLCLQQLPHLWSVVATDISDYFCPDKNPCKDPSKHLICAYKDQPPGKCGMGLKQYMMEQDFIGSLLETLNEHRRDVASGRATGAPDKDSKPTPLPRAYGMQPLLWDHELATLGMILSFRCIKDHDFTCADTYRFPNNIPWYVARSDEVVMAKVEEHRNKIISAELVKLLIDKKLHTSRDTLLPELITKCPRLDVQLTERDTSFLKVVQDGASHIGCALTDFLTKLNKTYVMVNLFLRCYISFRTPLDKPVYNTTPPLYGSGLSHKCGCRPFYREERGCLCVEYRPTSDSTPAFFHQPVYPNKTVRGPPEFESGFNESARVGY